MRDASEFLGERRSLQSLSAGAQGESLVENATSSRSEQLPEIIKATSTLRVSSKWVKGCSPLLHHRQANTVNPLSVVIVFSILPHRALRLTTNLMKKITRKQSNYLSMQQVNLLNKKFRNQEFHSRCQISVRYVKFNVIISTFCWFLEKRLYFLSFYVLNCRLIDYSDKKNQCFKWKLPSLNHLNESS